MALAFPPTQNTPVYNEENFEPRPEFLLYQELPVPVASYVYTALPSQSITFTQRTLPRVLFVRVAGSPQPTTFVLTVNFSNAEGLFADGTTLTVSFYSQNSSAGAMLLRGDGGVGYTNGGWWRRTTDNAVVTTASNGRSVSTWVMISGVWTRVLSRLTV